MTDQFDDWTTLVFGPVLHRVGQQTAGGAPAKAAAPGAPAQPPPVPQAPADPLKEKVDAAVAKLEQRKAQFAADGIPTRDIDAQIKQLNDAFANAKGKARAGLLKKAGTAEAAAGAEVARQDHAMTEGADKAIERLLKGAADQIATVPDPAKKEEFSKTLTGLQTRAAAATKIADPAARKQERAALDTAVQSLIKQAAAMPGQPQESKAALQAAFQDALTEKYGISIGKKGLTNKQNTNFEKMYEVFETVPLSDVTHVNMRDASYRDNLKDGGAIGFYGGKVSIQFGDFGDGKKAEPPGRYKDVTATTDAEKAEPPPNAFKITVLHELGHSVDSRFGLVDKVAYAKGGGDWKVTSAEALAKTAIAQLGPLPGIDPKDIQKATVAALTGKEKWPENADPASIEKLKTGLSTWMDLKSATWAKPVTRDDKRNYFLRDGNFYSYAAEDRQKLHVSDYQWSAPGEWFAELYALCWYKHRPPPAGVPDALRPYLPQKGDTRGPMAAET